MPKIVFDADPETGELTVEVEGVAGPACERLVEKLEQELGRPTEARRTAEYGQQGAVANRQQVGQGGGKRP